MVRSEAVVEVKPIPICSLFSLLVVCMLLVDAHFPLTMPHTPYPIPPLDHILLPSKSRRVNQVLRIEPL